MIFHSNIIVYNCDLYVLAIHICHRWRKMCSLARTRTWDPQNTVLRLYRLSCLASYTLSPLNSEEFWTMTYSPTILKFVLKFHRLAEQCELNSELYAITAPPCAPNFTGWEKCATWLGLEPGTLGIPYRSSTDWAVRLLTHHIP